MTKRTKVRHKTIDRGRHTARRRSLGGPRPYASCFRWKGTHHAGDGQTRFLGKAPPFPLLPLPARIGVNGPCRGCNRRVIFFLPKPLSSTRFPHECLSHVLYFHRNPLLVLSDVSGYPSNILPNIVQIFMQFFSCPPE